MQYTGSGNLNGTVVVLTNPIALNQKFLTAVITDNTKIYDGNAQFENRLLTLKGVLDKDAAGVDGYADVTAITDTADAGTYDFIVDENSIKLTGTGTITKAARSITLGGYTAQGSTQIILTAVPSVPGMAWWSMPSAPPMRPRLTAGKQARYLPALRKPKPIPSTPA